MENLYSISFVEKPEQLVWGIIGRGISSYNEQQAGDDGSQRICFAVQGTEQEVVGGIVAAIYWDWLYIDLMWLREDLRGQGYGSRLLAMAEEEARRRGAKHAFLDTFSFQAPEFYKKHGYHVFGELPNFPQGHTRYYFMKDL